MDFDDIKIISSGFAKHSPWPVNTEKAEVCENNPLDCGCDACLEWRIDYRADMEVDER